MRAYKKKRGVGPKPLTLLLMSLNCELDFVSVIFFSCDIVVIQFFLFIRTFKKTSTEAERDKKNSH